MKSLRKSISTKDVNASPISSPVVSLSKPSAAIQPPKKVIRAIAPYRPQAPTELPFQKGDFFYVIREVNESGAWYEAHNPLTGARGLVPRSLFDEFAKNAIGPRTFSTISTNTAKASAPKVKPRVFYAVVVHNFIAERTDELDAQAGDAISVVAQSNREWFVAKPIGRLGRPGLIPVSFVEVRDPVSNQPITDINNLLDSGELPRVEEWKRDMMNYKASSIALGVLDEVSNGSAPVPNSPYQSLSPTSPTGGVKSPPPMTSPGYPTPDASPVPSPWQSNAAAVQQPSLAPLTTNEPSPASVPSPEPEPEPEPEFESQPFEHIPTEPELLPDGIMLSANVVSFHHEMEEYWFRVHAIFQPYDPAGTTRLPSAKQLVLFRAYNDFYDFQVELLDTFPQEAGRQPGSSRILPYMPGPAKHVDAEVTANRQVDLDEYLNKLCELRSGARHILEDAVVRRFLAPKPGDVEVDVDPRTEEMDALYAYEYPSQETPGPEGQQFGQLQDTMGQMQLSNDQRRESAGSAYGDDGEGIRQPANFSASKAAPSRVMERDSEGGLSLRQQAYAHQRTGSSVSVTRAGQDSYPDSRSRASSRAGAAGSAGNSPILPNGMPSTRLSQAESVSSRSGATTNPNSPPISAANPQTAFVKIKIFDRVTDDLIAIRVHPRVTHQQLMEKVKARLGGNVGQLRFRDSGNDFVMLEGNQGLRDWIEGTDRHVLYAD